MKLGPYELGPNDTPENGIYCGDARELAQAIPDESIDLIFTDPVYQNIDDYRWLAETGARVLKSDGQALIYQAHKWLPETLAALGALTFVWMLGEEMGGAQARYWPLNLFIGWRPLLWYCKTKAPTFGHMRSDFSRATQTSGKNHKWHKRTGHLTRWIEQFASTDAVVADFFHGGGSVGATCKQLGRPYLAFEIDTDTCEIARDRVRSTQPPLFIPEPEQQMAMEAFK